MQISQALNSPTQILEKKVAKKIPNSSLSLEVFLIKIEYTYLIVLPTI